MEKYQEIERSIIKKYRKEIWRPFVKAVNEYELIQEKVGLKLKEGEEILYKNVLKKELNHSKIDIDVFVTTNIIISN